jgi:hypothetical protein
MSMPLRAGASPLWPAVIATAECPEGLDDRRGGRLTWLKPEGVSGLDRYLSFVPADGDRNEGGEGCATETLWGQRVFPRITEYSSSSDVMGAACLALRLRGTKQGA